MVDIVFKNTSQTIYKNTSDINWRTEIYGDWANRMKIEVDSSKIDDELTHFPVPIVLSSSAGQSSEDVTQIFDELALSNPTVTGDDFTLSDGDIYIGSIDDSFEVSDDDSFEETANLPDSELWDILNDSQREPYIESGKLQFSLVGSSIGTQRIISNFSLSGDFDIQIDWEYVVKNNINRNICRMWIAEEGNANLALLGREYTSTTDQYNFNTKVNGSYSTATTPSTTDTLGKFRYVRSGTTLSAYYWNGSSWTLIDSRSFSSAILRIWLDMETSTSVQDFVVNYDNFVINSGTIIWDKYLDRFRGNDGDLPDLKWWSPGTTPRWFIKSNKLETSVPTGSTYGTYYIPDFSGDFDIQIGFDCIGAVTGIERWELRLNLYDAGTSNRFIYERTWRSGGDKYFFNDYEGTWGSSVSTATSDTTGKLRVTRVGNLFTFYYWTSTGWAVLGSRTKVWSNIRLLLDAYNSTGSTVTLRFDDFIINSGTLVWRDNTHPNRKKIAITDESGGTPLFAETEYWDSENEKAVLWFSKYDLLLNSGFNDTLYFYFDRNQEDNIYYIGDTGKFEVINSFSTDKFTTPGGDDFVSSSDNFLNSDDSFISTLKDPDREKWRITNNTISGSAKLKDNKLQIRIPNTANDETLLVTSIFKVSGDFDIQVDYNEVLNDAPSSSLSYPALLRLITDDEISFYIGTRIDSSGVQRMYVNSTNTTSSITTSAHFSSGKLRLVRTGSTTKAYYWTGTQWEWNGSTSGFTFSETTTDDTKCRIYSQANFDSGCTTDFDDFEIVKGIVKHPASMLVWDPDYKAVYHMAQNPAAGTDCIKDSSVNEVHGTPDGTWVAEDSVQGDFIGKALAFDGTQLIDCGLTSLFNSMEYFTIEAAVTFDTETFSASQTVARMEQVFAIGAGWSNDYLTAYFNNGSWSPTHGNTDVTGAHALVCRLDNGVTSVIVDGSLETNGSIGVPLSNASDKLALGGLISGASRVERLIGKISETRFSTVPRSNAWAKASNYTLKDNFLTLSFDEGAIITVLEDMKMDIQAFSESKTDIKLDLSAYFQGLTDSKTDLDVIGSILEDMVWDGVIAAKVLEDLKIDVSAYFQSLSDGKFDLVLWQSVLHDLKMDLHAAVRVIEDSKFDISAGLEALNNLTFAGELAQNIIDSDCPFDLSIGDGIIFKDNKMDINIGDGNKIESLGLSLTLVSPIPVYKAVYGIHLESAIKDVT